MENNKKHILIVDDDNRIRELLKEYLRENDYIVSTSENAENAKIKLAQFKFSLIVLDVMMPGQNGYDLTNEIKKNIKVPIILLTAKGEVENRIKGLELGCAEEDVSPMVLGGHGDTMVPLPRYTTVGGIPITQLMSQERIEAISARTASGGGEIVKLLERGSAFYAPGSAAAIMAESVLNNRRRLLPASCHLTGQYGLDEVYIGVPCLLGSNGVEQIFELDLSEGELASLQESGNFYKNQLKDVLGY